MLSNCVRRWMHQGGGGLTLRRGKSHIGNFSLATNLSLFFSETALDAHCAAQEARSIEARPPLPLFLLQLLVDCCFSATVAVAAATVAVAVVVDAVTIATVTIAIAAVGKCMTNEPLALAPSPPLVSQH
jgi:hypothetical protein